jgi:beta-lactamase superfamily II metal-dependent hydrolase
MKRVAQGFSPAILVAALSVVLFAQAPVRGSLPPWTRGTLDFHQISTGRGNAALVVFPDGTTMLVDAGAVRDGETIADTDPRPNNTRTAGACIADYIVSRGVSRLDYVVLTHFDADHILGLSRCRRAPADRHRDRSRARVLEAPRR